MHILKKTRYPVCAAGVAWILAVASDANAQTERPNHLPSQDTLRYQEQQLQGVKEQALAPPEVLTPVVRQNSELPDFPIEAPCFAIAEVEWRGAEHFPWLPGRVPIEGTCMGAQGRDILSQWIARQLIADGYITTQVFFPEQDFATGHLVIEIVPGRVGTIRDEGASIGWSRMVFPERSHALLNIRDLDQALENIRRLPGQGVTAFDLVPGTDLGESDIVIRHPQNRRRVRFVLTADNSGIHATGRNQLGAIVAIDSPLHLYDQLIATVNNDAGLRNHSAGSRSKSIAWNVPIGYASFSLGFSEWSSKQALPVVGADILYTSRTRRFEAGVTYVPYRTSHNKGSLQFNLVRRQDQASLGGEEIGVQKRDITSYEIRASHLEMFSDASLHAAIGLRGSLAGLSRTPGFVYGQSNWSGRYQILTTSTSLNVPFRIDSRAFGYRGTFFLQHALQPTPFTEYLQIGGRYSVRGSDGNQSLAVQNGWTWRNELATGLFAGSETYVALDAGQVSGDPATARGRTLIGSALGIRGSYRGLGYDVSVGMPLLRPDTIQTGTPSLNVRMTYRF
ncbi:ShlB/FhaC/HecB family hemolysin secretion/activation protein [Paraburkholderia megapolitana]|nr:ShlB/FhaC/HecB family hemolysin secretion/activation protein [Paraburkholderia megapolitana]QDQ79874.1 ShlB/FhaC/HecB family hemolysin secretion/activation protein [Paraburkholderia megapolitana]